VAYETAAVAGSDELYVYGGFQAKNRKFIDCLAAGKELTSSPFRDVLATMKIAERILARSLLDGSWPPDPVGRQP
jgi:virulence factor